MMPYDEFIEEGPCCLITDTRTVCTTDYTPPGTDPGKGAGWVSGIAPPPPQTHTFSNLIFWHLYYYLHYNIFLIPDTIKIRV